MTNTNLRIISAIVMILILVISSFIGREAMLALVGVIGFFVVDEFVVNINKKNRKHISYIASQLTFIVGYTFFNFVDVDFTYFSNATNVAVAINCLLLFYLFIIPMDSMKFLKSIQSSSYLIGLFILLPFLSLSWILHRPNWGALLILLGLLNFVVDSAAWFFGKMYGNKKLWPTISPKKTIVGAVGGALSGVVISSVYSYSYFGQISLAIIGAFIVTTISAQLGDLIQSKFKRQSNIKDSSNLIPGHGGMYDRVDSLIFVAPIFAIITKYFY